jgi:hypothetical protein
MSLTNKFAYLVDYSKARILRKDTFTKDQSAVPYSLPNTFINNEYKNIATEDYFYLHEEINNLPYLGIYKHDWGPASSNKFGSLIYRLGEKNGRAFIASSGLFMILTIEDNAGLKKISADGTTTIWTRKIPYCQNDAKFFIASCSLFTYVVYSKLNIVSQFNTTDGKLIIQYSLAEKNVVDIECSTNDFFVLYGDASVVQYTKESYYVDTYMHLERKILSQYNKLKVASGYLFCLLCDAGQTEVNCQRHSIIQWKLTNTVKSNEIQTLQLSKVTSGLINTETSQPLDSETKESENKITVIITLVCAIVILLIVLFFVYLFIMRKKVKKRKLYY